MTDLRSGLYVAQFFDHVKTGRARDVRSRLTDHRRDGATRAAGYAVPYEHGAEREVLRVLLRCAVPIGSRSHNPERFTGVTFEEVENVVVTIARRYVGDWPETLGAW